MTEYLKKLTDFVGTQYGIGGPELSAAERGFYGETWKIKGKKDCENQSFFLKLDFWLYHKNQLRDSLGVAKWLAGQVHEFVVPPIESVEGKLYCEFEQGILALFPFVEGEHTEDYPLDRLFRRLGRVYTLDYGNCPKVQTDALDNGVLLHLNRLMEELDKAEPELAKETRAILEGQREIIEHCKERLMAFSALKLGDEARFCLTHGDAGGNCILRDKDFVIIDWDQVMLAPAERDIWYFMQQWWQLDLIREILEPLGISVDSDRMCYYCYRMFFYYICCYLEALIKPSPRGCSRGELLKQLSEYFESWIFNCIKVADRIEPGVKITVEPV